MSGSNLIRTPSDFGYSISGHCFARHELAKISPAEESEVREVLDQIFSDLEYMEQSDHELLRAYLSGIEEPLEALWKLGLCLVWFRTKGSYRSGAETIPDWRTTHYLLVSQRGLFAVTDTPSVLVHRFVNTCKAGWDSLIKALISPSKGIFSWRSLNSVRLTKELAFTLCEHCEGKSSVSDLGIVPESQRPGWRLLEKAGWLRPSDSCFPEAVHLVIRHAALGVLASGAGRAGLEALVTEMDRNEAISNVNFARLSLFLALETGFAAESTSAPDRAKALCVLLLLGKAWGWELGASDFRMPTTAPAPLRMVDYCASKLKTLDLPDDVAKRLMQLATDETLPSQKAFELEDSVRAIVDSALWAKADKLTEGSLEDKKWAAVRMLKENPQESISAIAARVGLDRSHFYRDPMLRNARLMSGGDVDRLRRGVFDARTGQVDGEVVDGDQE